MSHEHAPILVVGAGVAGLSAAIALASEGLPVTVIEAAGHGGGKVRSCERDDLEIDVGPTVFTMPWVFEELLDRAGSQLHREVDLAPLDVLAHHRWPDGSQLDLFADHEQTLDAIGHFAGPAAVRQYEAFSELSGRMYGLLRDTFLKRPQPGLFGLIRNAGIARMHALTGLHPFTTLWDALEDQFDDGRLRQLFARYSTYCGSSPFASPATLMLIAHVERLGVFSIRGGMRALVAALVRVADRLGVRFCFDCRVDRILVSQRRISGIELAGGEQMAARHVIVGTDKNAIASGRFGRAVRRAAPPTPVERRSLSARTWAGHATISETGLAMHNVLFSNDYAAEFRQLFDERRIPTEPTIYAYLPDAANGPGRQRIFILVNAPADGDSDTRASAPSNATTGNIDRRLAANGIALARGLDALEATGPEDFERRYPATGGALYGEATHGWRAAFERPGSRTGIPGLYLAGGSVHPGPGVPMAALSGRIAAACLLEDAYGITKRARA
jgi:1-hydroxycarotenoid 3,4-desaturase